MERLISTTILLLNFLLSFLPKEEVLVVKDIEGVNGVQQVIWRDKDTLLMVKEKDIFQYDLESNTNSVVGEREANEFVGVGKNGEILLCKIEHFSIDSYDDFSTKFTVWGKELYFFETIRPLYLNEEKIVAVTALDFLEQHYYEIDISTGEKREIYPVKKSFTFKTSEDIDFKKAYVWDEGRYVVEDIFGNLYFYNTVEKFKINYLRNLKFTNLEEILYNWFEKI